MFTNILLLLQRFIGKVAYYLHYLSCLYSTSVDLLYWVVVLKVWLCFPFTCGPASYKCFVLITWIMHRKLRFVGNICSFRGLLFLINYGSHSWCFEFVIVVLVDKACHPNSIAVKNLPSGEHFTRLISLHSD